MSEVVGTSNVWPNYSKGNTSPASSKDGTMGKDQFLKILITQLKNQDPMQPLQDKDFIAQMAQFTSVEQLTNLAAQMTGLRHDMNLSTGASLIGKKISWTGNNPDGTVAVKEGVVSAITFKDGVQYAVAGDEPVPMDKLLKIWNAEVTP